MTLSNQISIQVDLYFVLIKNNDVYVMQTNASSPVVI